MNTLLQSLPKLRYSTAGDYFEEDGQLKIQVFEQGNEDHNLLIAVHELVEQRLCEKAGITNEMIDAFDFEYEKNRKEGDTDSEPGDDPDCPYRDQHRFAMIVEQLVAKELGVEWNDYNDNIKVYEPE